jgi:flagellar basal body P-ring formation protein FlgA
MRLALTRMSLRRVVAGVALALVLGPCVALSDEIDSPAALMAPVPKVVIYPGDIIRDEMLMDAPRNEIQGASAAMIQNREGLVGKMARRTLLPGRAIPASSVNNPRAVTVGAQVKIVYVDGGLTIIASASALQDGAIGDAIKVRNEDSGLTISGVIQADGSVRVSGG